MSSRATTRDPVNNYLNPNLVGMTTKMESNTKILTNYKKAKSLLEKIISMMENGEYCIDIMQQNLAVIGLLKSAHQQLMESHLNSCFKHAMSTNNQKRKDQMIEEILKVTHINNK